MPFFSITRASLGASMLKSSLERSGIGCDVHYFNIDLAEELGFFDYGWIGEISPPASLVGDWIFSPWAHPNNAAPADDDAEDDRDASYIANVLLRRFGHKIGPGDALRLLHVRDRIGHYLEQCLARCDWSSYRVVGFTTTFNQTCASLSLARMIKERHPDVMIVFGGSNCEGDMGPGLLDAYDCIDAVCSGEGEAAFPLLVRSVLDGKAIHSAGGMTVRRSTGSPVSVPGVVMDALPYPDFDDYYRAIETSGFKGQFKPLVPFETARGCWWGEKKHCTFCGLNGLSMAFRSKSQERAFEELATLVEKYGTDILCVDNILDMKYFKSFLPRLASASLNINLHYEVKVNLSKPQLRILSDAGVAAIQPGIESFIDPVLRLMEKGSSRLQNIQLMRWCREAGIQVAWNLLYGFPGEDASDYRDMIAFLDQLSHLDPPQHCGRVRADRHSPYFMKPDDYGVTLDIEPAYSFVYRHAPERVRRIAYYFDMIFEGKDRIAEYESSLQEAVAHWQTRSSAGATLAVRAEGTDFTIVDTRQGDEPVVCGISRQEAAILRACDAISGLDVTSRLPIWNGEPQPSASLDAIERLVARGWLLRKNNQLLALPLIDRSALGA